MRIDLGQLAAESLELELPGAQDQPTRRARIAAIAGLRGQLTTSPEGWALTDVGASELALAALAWRFGAVALSTDRTAQLSGLTARTAQRHGVFELDLSSAGLIAQPLTLEVGGLTLRANVEARGVGLQVRPQVGRLTAAQATFRELELRTATLHLRVPELSVSELVVDWSGAFRLEAGTAEAAELSLTQRGATISAHDVALAALVSAGRTLSLGQARMARVEVEGARAQAGATAASASPPPRREVTTANPETPPARTDALARYLDLRLLDGLSGRIAIDVFVDISVPIIGRRRATHALRVTVDRGAIDYLALENGLATLEDSLLDFSVREGGLVLERGLPLIATRGRGKPILRWDLTPDDLTLAQQNRVRLAVLPNFRSAASRDSEPPSEEDGSGSSFALRQLSLGAIDVALSLLQPAVAQSGAVRELTFANLSVRGDVHHHPGEREEPGRVLLELANLRALLDGLPLGEEKLRGRIEIAALRGAELGFEDLRAGSFKGTIEGLALAELAFG